MAEVVPRLRIVLVTGTLEVGGAETQVVRLAQELSAVGHQVKVVALLGGGPLEQQLRDAGVPLHVTRLERRHRGGPAATAAALVSFARAVVGQRPDVVQARLPIPRMVAMPLAFVGGVPVRVANRVEQWPGSSLRHGWQVRMHRLATRCTSVVGANSSDVARATVETEGVPRRKVRVIPNGLSFPARGAAAGLEPPVGVMVANLTAVKAHRDLVTALARMDHPPRVRLVGEGPERAALESQVEAERLGEVVTFEGLVQAGATRFADGQFALLTSHAEGMPNVVMEAMAYGLPVVATAVGGVPELVEDGVTGLLVEPGDPEALAGAVRKLVDDPELRVRMGAEARRRAEAFAWPHNVELHEEVYAEVLRSTRRGRRRLARLRRGR